MIGWDCKGDCLSLQKYNRWALFAILGMNTSEVIKILQLFKAKFSEKFGIKSLGLFGSFARMQQQDSSDVDVVVSLKESDFFTLVAIQEELEKMIGHKVDVVNFRDSLRDSFKANILKDAIFV